MSRLPHRDGLILAVLAAVTLIPAGIGLASLLRELLFGEAVALLGLHTPLADVGTFRDDGRDMVVTFDQDLQPHRRAAIDHSQGTPVTIIWDGDIAASAAPRTAKSGALAALSGIRHTVRAPDEALDR